MGNQRPHRPPEVETLERVRRTETRVTQIAIALGLKTAQDKPVFAPGLMPGDDATITVPSVHSSLKEIVDSVPKGWHGTINVLIGNYLVVKLTPRG